MESLLNNFKAVPVLIRHRFLLPALTAALYSAIALIGMKHYLEWTSVNFIIGVATMPLMLSAKGKGKWGYRFALLALALMIAGFIIPVKTILYLSLCSLLLFICEAGGRKLSVLPFLSCLVIAPVCTYFTHIFSFPIRLWLTSVAGKLLQHIDPDVTVAGNIISFSKTDFSVDPACMGLNMLVTSLLCGLIMLAVFLKRKNAVIAWPWIMLSLLVMVALNTISNLIRILILVYFKILPENPLHELTGIICFLVYVLLPGSLLIKALVKLRARLLKPEIVPEKKPLVQSGLLHLILLPMLIFLAFRTHQRETAPSTATLPFVPDYRICWYNKDVIKMENDHALIYVKPLKGFVYTDHNPLICWTGSGYLFRNVEEQSWNGIALFTGMLTNGKDTLYTAWWYDNGIMSTTGQWTWRWNMLCGDKDFSIINVTANDPETLRMEVIALAAKRDALFL